MVNENGLHGGPYEKKLANVATGTDPLPIVKNWASKYPSKNVNLSGPVFFWSEQNGEKIKEGYYNPCHE